MHGIMSVKFDVRKSNVKFFRILNCYQFLIKHILGVYKISVKISGTTQDLVHLF